MGRSPCCEKVGLKKGPWTPEEDQKLLAYIEEHGHGNWRALPARAGLQRCGKSCRLRWTNYLRPDIKRGKFSLQEEQTIIQLHALLGNRWSAIATHLPKRTDNEIKNHWNTLLKKRLTKMGIDPVTHKAQSGTLIGGIDGQSKSNIADISHMAQWESARLEAEARLVMESKLRAPSITPRQQLDPVLLPQLHMKLAPSLDVIQAWKGIWPQSSGGNHGKVHLESPTPTLSFSSVQGLVDRNLTIYHQGEEGILEGDKVELKCFGKSTSLLDAKDHTIPGFSVDPTLFGTEESSWLEESLSIRTGTGSSGGDFGVAGFTEMLLDNSDEQHSTTDSENADVGSCVEEEDDDDESSTYWNSLLDLVNSPPPVDSPPHLF